MPIRYLFLFVGLVTLTAVGQSTTKDLSAFEPPLNVPCQVGRSIDSDLPQCLFAKPKKHKAPVKVTPIGINDPNGPQCVMGKSDEGCPVDDGVAHWQAPKQPPVPEAIKDGTICDHLPDIQKVTCLMNLVAPEKVADQKPEGFSPDGGCNWCQGDSGPCTLRACPKTPDPIKTAQDGYDCTMDRTLKTITISCTLKEPK